MRLTLTLASLLGLFTVIHTVPIQHNEAYNRRMVYKTLNKRDDYERGRESSYYDDGYEGRYDRYNEMKYNPSFFRNSYPSYRGSSMPANRRVYRPQYYTQPQYTNTYSEADMQSYIAAAAVAAANAVASSNSATPGTPGTLGTPGTVSPAAGADTLTYETMLTSSDPQVLFGNSQSTTANTQPASSPFAIPGFNTGQSTIATPVQANVAPPRA
ncbi:hypothetical protein K501DRAFT_279585 [Backusella circina FSU 941]|nr:hypothetical protein K501DRAFT_279585 [Backusella circina FSU 941]